MDTQVEYQCGGDFERAPVSEDTGAFAEEEYMARMFFSTYPLKLWFITC